MPRFYFVTGVAIILGVLIYGCAEHIVSDCEKAGEKDTASSLISFADLQKNVFDASCAIARCHASVSPGENLDLTAVFI